MKKLLLITNTSNGLYLFRQELILRLKSEYYITILASDTGRIEELKKMGCDVILLPIERRGKNPFRDFSLFCFIISMMIKVKPDFTLTYTIKPNIYGGLASRFLRIPYAANVTGLGTAFQSKLIKKLIIPLYRIGVNKAKVVFCENSTIKEELIEYRIVDKEKICVLSGAGVNINRFSYIRYPKDSKPFKFLFVGRIMKEKGIEELIEATSKLNENGIICELTVVGGFEENYSALFQKYNWLRYEGKQKDVRPFIGATHCFVLPSYHEGMANTNLECASSGRPIITSNIPGCREAVIEGITGFLCEPKNANDLYMTMKKMTCLDNATREKMGLAGRKLMEEYFDKQKVIEETIRRIHTLT